MTSMVNSPTRLFNRIKYLTPAARRNANLSEASLMESLSSLSVTKDSDQQKSISPSYENEKAAPSGLIITQYYCEGSAIPAFEDSVLLKGDEGSTDLRACSETLSIIKQLSRDFVTGTKDEYEVLVVHFVCSHSSLLSQDDRGSELCLHLSSIWPKGWRAVRQSKGSKSLMDAINALFGKRQTQPTGASAPSLEVTSLAIHKQGTFVQVPQWHFSKIETQPRENTRFFVRCPRVVMHIPLKLKVYCQLSHGQVKSGEILPPIYVWLEDPFGRVVTDMQRYPTIEAICARPHDSALRGSASRSCDPSSGCVIFDGLSVAGQGEHMLLFVAKSAEHFQTSDSSWHHPENLTANMAPFHVIIM